ncbi:MAG: ATP-binding protein [Pseudonocardiaceae bacterium]
MLRPVGLLSALTYRELRDGLLRCAEREPAALVVDLDGLRVNKVTSLAVFPAVRMRIDNWPGVPMALAAGRQPLRALLESSAVPRFVPTYPSVAHALEAVPVPPRRRRREVVLSREVTSGRRTRAMVEQTCREWLVPGIATDAVQVASELAENIIRHARSDGWLRLELCGGALTIAAGDADSRPPRVCPPAERHGGGRGLALVAELSRAWGYTPQAQGGKVVWAVLKVPGRESPP